MLVATARIYPFPDRKDEGHRLSVRDRLDLHGAGQRITGAGLRCVVGQDRDGLCHDFVQLHTAGRLVWTFVREGRTVRAWRGACGTDLGAFASMAEALDAALAATPPGKPPRRPPGTPRPPSAGTPSH